MSRIDFKMQQMFFYPDQNVTISREWQGKIRQEEETGGVKENGFRVPVT